MRGDVEGELDTAPEGVPSRESELDAIGSLGRNELTRPALHDLDAVVAPGQGRATAGPEIVDDLALGEHTKDIGV